MTEKRNKKGNVPNLRFPGFDEEWERKKLGEIATFYSGGTPLTSKREYFDGNIPFIRSGEINSDKTEQFISELGLKNSSAKMVERGDILYALYGATSGEVGISKIKGAINQAVLCIKSTENHYFLYSYLSVKKETITKTYLQGGQGNLSAEIVKQIGLSISTIKEQSKISDFLSLIDDRIATQNKIIEHLKTQMLGLQGKLFGQQVKLKDERDKPFPQWEFRLGGELFDSISNKSHNSDLPILAITQDQGAIPRELIDYQITVTDKSVESYKIVEIGDFIISLRSFQGGIEYSKYKGICSPAYVILRNKIKMNLLFYRYFFKTDVYIRLLNKKLEGIRDGKMISYTYFSEILLPFPSLKEQERIACILSVFDQKIETEKAILKQLEKQKKYLLQQMFI